MSAPIVVSVDASIRDLVPLFLEQRRQDQLALENAVEKADFMLARRAAHAMTGASASYGFDALSALGERLSMAARAGDLASMRQLKRELDDYLSRLVVKYL